jgi:hypothetical protein
MFGSLLQLFKGIFEDRNPLGWSPFWKFLTALGFLGGFVLGELGKYDLGYEFGVAGFFLVIILKVSLDLLGLSGKD